MHIVRFKVEGVFNSFRMPFFRTYHKTFLAPPKTTIIGMITNIMGKSEDFFYNILNQDEIKISVVIDSIRGRAKDLWTYKTFENKSNMHGRSIIRRDRLFNAKYTIYLMIDDKELSEEIYNSLLYPESVPSLGLDDEIVKIYDVVYNLDFDENRTGIVNSVFMDRGYEYQAKVDDFSNMLEIPTANVVPLKYKIKKNKNVRSERTGIDLCKQIEFLNCYVEIKDIKSYMCENNKLIFY